jgi:transcription elongation factor GreA
MKKTQLTQEGFEKLQRELRELTEVKRPQAVSRLQKARAMGDLSENSEYVAAKEDLAFIEGRIQEVEEIIKNAEIAETQKRKDIISLGSTVTVRFNGSVDTFSIVGEFEADPMKKKISQTSPIGQALVGKKAGAVVEVETPSGKTTYRIVEIN